MPDQPADRPDSALPNPQARLSPMEAKGVWLVGEGVGSGWSRRLAWKSGVRAMTGGSHAFGAFKEPGMSLIREVKRSKVKQIICSINT